MRRLMRKLTLKGVSVEHLRELEQTPPTTRSTRRFLFSRQLEAIVQSDLGKVFRAKIVKTAGNKVF